MTIRMLGTTMVLAALAIGTASCGAAPDGGDTAADESGRTRAALQVDGKGPVRLVAQAFEDVPLDPAQRAEIEQLASAAAERHAKVAEAKADALRALADQVEAGHVDRATLHPKAKAIFEAMKASRPEDRAAIERLHAMLDEDQREDLVEGVEDRISEKMWSRRNDGGPRAWKEKLALTDDQEDRIHDIVKEELGKGVGPRLFWERMKRGKAALEAFEEDELDLDEVMPAEEMERRAKEMEGKVLAIAEAVVPLLTPEQRKIAAGILRERAAEGGGPF